MPSGGGSVPFVHPRKYAPGFHGMTNVSIPKVNMFKNSSTLAVSAPINLSIKLVIVSVNGPRESYLLDALGTNIYREMATGTFFVLNFFFWK